VTRVWMVVALAVGLVAGAAGALALQSDPPDPAPTRALPVREVALPQPSGRVLLVWTHGGLPAGLASGVGRLDGVGAVTEVHGDDVGLVQSTDAAGRVVDATRPGWMIPLDAMAFDPATYPAFVPEQSRPLFAGLRPGQAILGATSARVRRLGPGGVLQLTDGRRLTVAAIVDDTVVGAAELVVSSADPAATGWPARYLLVNTTGTTDGVEKVTQGLLPPGTPVRFRLTGETPFLREGDAVLPQALIKDRFGEFAFRDLAGRDIEVDPAWVSTHIVTAAVPILGRITCHRAVIGAVRAALIDLVKSNLASLVDPAAFAGCFAAKRVNPGEPVSRHAWGVALDVNYRGNQTGVSSAQDPRLVAVMARYGFTSGADWLQPDPAHFEYIRAPRL
jgi:hypothetical protein